MARALFWRMKANGQIVLGISSYQEFPSRITNLFDDRHTNIGGSDVKSCQLEILCPQDIIPYLRLDTHQDSATQCF